MIAFGNLKYLVYIAATAGVVLALFIFYMYWKRSVLAGIARRSGSSLHLIRGSFRRARVREGLIIAAIILSAFVVLRPQRGEKVREVRNEGSDVLIALDVSRSMLAEDVGPSRLRRAKDAVKWIVESLKGDRVGLILFAGDAFLQCPLTSDYGAFMMFLESAGPGSIPYQGTDIGRALEEAIRVFEKKRLTSKLLVLITDGEDHQGAAGPAAARFRKMDVSVYTVGIGREKGEYIPAGEDEETEDNYFRDRSGKLVRTRKNPDLLKKLAASTRGSYIDITGNLSGLRFILQIIEDQQTTQYGTRIIKERREYYQVFTLILIVLLAAELLIPERKREPGPEGLRGAVKRLFSRIFKRKKYNGDF